MGRFTAQEAVVVAQTTLNHLAGGENGYNKLVAMLAMKNLTHSKDGVISFQFEGWPTANIVRIELNESDLYDITFFKFNKRSLEIREVLRADDLYADQLKEYFETTTGLYTSLI